MLTQNFDHKVSRKQQIKQNPGDKYNNLSMNTNHRRSFSLPNGFSVVGIEEVKYSNKVSKFENGIASSMLIHQDGPKTPCLKSLKTGANNYLANLSEDKCARRRLSKTPILERSNSAYMLEGSSVSLGQSTHQKQNTSTFFSNLDRLIDQLQSQTLVPNQPRGTLETVKTKDKPQLVREDKPVSKNNSLVNTFREYTKSQQFGLSKVQQPTYRRFIGQNIGLQDSQATIEQRETIKSSNVSSILQRRSSMIGRDSEKRNNLLDQSDRGSIGLKSSIATKGDNLVGMNIKLRSRGGSLPKFLQENYSGSLGNSIFHKGVTMAGCEPAGYYLTKEQFESLTANCSLAIQKYNECEKKIEKLERQYSRLNSGAMKDSKLDPQKSEIEESYPIPRDGGLLDREPMFASSDSTGWQSDNNSNKNRNQRSPWESNPLVPTKNIQTRNRIDEEKKSTPFPLGPRRTVYDLSTRKADYDKQAFRKAEISLPMTMDTVKDNLRQKVGGLSLLQCPEGKKSMGSKKITM
jgi:hypothetical protein